MDRSFDFILAGIALIVGIMLLTGHGDIFLKGGNTKLRKEKYDEKKMTKGSGVTLILFGIVTFIDPTQQVLLQRLFIFLQFLRFL